MSVSVHRDVVILACAISAGIHGALAPRHFDEGGSAGGAFAAAAAILGVVAVALTRRPRSKMAIAAAAATFAGLLASYGLATTSGIPLLHPEPEAVEGVAVATKAVEAIGLVAATTLLARRLSVAPTLLEAKGTRT